MCGFYVFFFSGSIALAFFKAAVVRFIFVCRCNEVFPFRAGEFVPTPSRRNNFFF